MSSSVGDEFLTVLARNVRSARLQIGLTIEELAERADLNVLMLDAIERGEGGRLDMHGLVRLAVVLERSPATLMARAIQRMGLLG